MLLRQECQGAYICRIVMVQRKVSNSTRRAVVSVQRRGDGGYSRAGESSFKIAQWVSEGRATEPLRGHSRNASGLPCWAIAVSQEAGFGCIAKSMRQEWMGISEQHGCACQPGTLERCVKKAGRRDDAATDWPCPPRRNDLDVHQWGCPSTPSGATTTSPRGKPGWP